MLMPWHGQLLQQTFEAFNLVKQQLAAASILEHYDPAKPLSLATDASPYGIGAVMFHVSEDGTEKPIACASRTLNDIEKRYSQLDKEALAIMFGVKRFHHYVYGRQFAIDPTTSLCSTC